MSQEWVAEVTVIVNDHVPDNKIEACIMKAIRLIMLDVEHVDEEHGVVEGTIKMQHVQVLERLEGIEYVRCHLPMYCNLKDQTPVETAELSDRLMMILAESEARWALRRTATHS